LPFFRPAVLQSLAEPSGSSAFCALPGEKNSAPNQASYCLAAPKSNRFHMPPLARKRRKTENTGRIFTSSISMNVQVSPLERTHTPPCVSVAIASSAERGGVIADAAGHVLPGRRRNRTALRTYNNRAPYDYYTTPALYIQSFHDKNRFAITKKKEPNCNKAYKNFLTLSK
jgi:hypothetical protein